MSSVDYLKMKFERERQMALDFERGAKSALKDAQVTISDIYQGFERASWYSSCFFDSYKEVCSELKHEDFRSFIAIKELYLRRDVIYDMLMLYARYVLRKAQRDPWKTLNDTKIKTMGLATSIAVGTATKTTLSHVIAEGVAYSNNLRVSVKTRIMDKGMTALTIIKGYGIQQKSALAARRLKILEPEFYFILYANNIEMLYVFIEPVLSKIIRDIKALKTANEDDIIRIYREHF